MLLTLCQASCSFSPTLIAEGNLLSHNALPFLTNRLELENHTSSPSAVSAIVLTVHERRSRDCFFPVMIKEPQNANAGCTKITEISGCPALSVLFFFFKKG